MNRKLVIILAVLTGALIAAPARAQLQINGYLSFHYQNGESSGESPDGAFGDARAGLFFSGLLERVFAYNLEVRFDTPDVIQIQEAWAAYQPSDAFHLKLGMYLVPFGTYNTASRPYQTPFIKTPLPQSVLYPESWRDLGLLTEGHKGVFGYAIYIGNGLREAADLGGGQQFKDNNTNKAAGGKITLDLSRDFEVGFSYNHSKFDDLGERDLSLWAAHVDWQSQSFRLLYEYDDGEIENPAGFERGKIHGHLALFSFNWGGAAPFVSYQDLDYDDPYHGAGFPASPEAGPTGIALEPAGIALANDRWAIGLVFTPVQSVMFKLEYDFNGETPEIHNDLFLAQVALHF